MSTGRQVEVTAGRAQQHKNMIMGAIQNSSKLAAAIN